MERTKMIQKLKEEFDEEFARIAIDNELSWEEEIKKLRSWIDEKFNSLLTYAIAEVQKKEKNVEEIKELNDEIQKVYLMQWATGFNDCLKQVKESLLKLKS